MNLMWRITRDLVEPDEADMAESVRYDEKYAGTMRKFRMYDDDGELMYEGEGNCLDHDDGFGFEPLDDFGMPNAGCTEIHWHNPEAGEDVWELL